MNIIFLAIIVGEIAFWIFLLLGLLLRYKWGYKQISLVLLASTPIIDLFLLFFTLIDLSNGVKPHFFHGLSAAYIGFSIMYGHRTIRWADNWASYKWSAGNRPVKKKLYGKEDISYQWKEFFRFTICIIIISTLIALAFLIVPFEDTFWLIYWLINNVGMVIIWLLIGPIRSITKNKPKSSF